LLKQISPVKNTKRKIKHRIKRRKIFLRFFKKIKLSRRLFFIKYSFKRLFKNFFNILILFFFKSLKIFFFKIYNRFSSTLLNFLLFFKKKNLFFKKQTFAKNIKSKLLNNSKSLTKNRPYSRYINLKIYEKNILNNKKKTIKKTKIYSIKHHFLKSKIKNINLLKTFFFKNELIKKKLDNFLNNIGKSNGSFYKNINRTLYINLIRAHFFFFINDIKFFIKQKFIFINGKTTSNPLHLVKLGDVIQIPLIKKYFKYQKSTLLYFKQKLKFLKYQR
jgi:ribosomal protein S4